MDEILAYTPIGDYLLPDLALDETMEQTEPLGRYGRLRQAYLKEHRTIRYNAMLLQGILYPHLRETEALATARMERVMSLLLEQSSLPSKEADPLGWMAAMNGLRAQAEETVLHEVVYA